MEGSVGGREGMERSEESGKGSEDGMGESMGKGEKGAIA